MEINSVNEGPRVGNIGHCCCIVYPSDCPQLQHAKKEMWIPNMVQINSVRTDLLLGKTHIIFGKNLFFQYEC
jgi:hypothetical protein